MEYSAFLSCRQLFGISEQLNFFFGRSMLLFGISEQLYFCPTQLFLMLLSLTVVVFLYKHDNTLLPWDKTCLLKIGPIAFFLKKPVTIMVTV